MRRADQDVIDEAFAKAGKRALFGREVIVIDPDQWHIMLKREFAAPDADVTGKMRMTLVYHAPQGPVPIAVRETQDMFEVFAHTAELLAASEGVVTFNDMTRLYVIHTPDGSAYVQTYEDQKVMREALGVTS